MMFLVATAAAALAAAPAPAPAAGPARGSVDYDIQCMIVTEQVTEGDKVDASTKSQIALAMMFYFGRVDSAMSGDALKARIKAGAKRMEGQQIGPILRDCGEYMTTRGTAMQAMGHSLESENGAPAK